MKLNNSKFSIKKSIIKEYIQKKNFIFYDNIIIIKEFM